MNGNEQVFAYLVDRENSGAELANINYIRTSLTKSQCGHTVLPWFLYEIVKDGICEIAKCKSLRHGIENTGVKLKILEIIKEEPVLDKCGC